MNKILLVTAHPALEKSRNNIRLMQTAQQMDNVRVRDLYELYPRFSINTRKEQDYLEQSDIIVLQHPFYWYSIPALMKQYLDMVFTHGWAYGRNGNKLEGKILFNAITTSGTRDSYRSDQHNRFSLATYLAPYDQLAHVCRMQYLPPFVLHESGKADASASARHARAFRNILTRLAAEGASAEDFRTIEYLNDYQPEHTAVR